MFLSESGYNSESDTEFDSDSDSDMMVDDMVAQEGARSNGRGSTEAQDRDSGLENYDAGDTELEPEYGDDS
ncbi:hypothetical protein K474DRAFT_1669061 [Panus rudis PR-1116 ss-1]|nr:hypothetical protein K474DRAFT_1669061 [Panus rudis PR-1116 ss-1]